MPNDYATMKEIGAVFAISSHGVGKKLKELGLRTLDGKPSSEAYRQGLVQQRWTHDHAHYCWAWHWEKTVALLREAGCREVEK